MIRRLLTFFASSLMLASVSFSQVPEYKAFTLTSNGVIHWPVHFWVSNAPPLSFWIINASNILVGTGALTNEPSFQSWLTNTYIHFDTNASYSWTNQQNFTSIRLGSGAVLTQWPTNIEFWSLFPSMTNLNMNNFSVTNIGTNSLVFSDGTVISCATWKFITNNVNDNPPFMTNWAKHPANANIDAGEYSILHRWTSRASQEKYTYPVRGTSFYVATYGNDTNAGTSWECPVQSIQQGVNIAGSSNTVIVNDGLYYMPNSITLSNAVNLVSYSEHGAIIDGSNAFPCIVNVYTGMNHIVGFTIQNGRTTASGGGILLYTDVHIERCLFFNNRSAGVVNGGNHVYSGPAIFATERSSAWTTLSEISECVFFKNVLVNASALNEGNWHGSTAFGGSDYRKFVTRNCLFVGNDYTNCGFVPGVIGGGATSNESCTFVGNNGMISRGANPIYNAIAWSNSVTTVEFVAYNSCAPLLSGSGNITDDPQFVSLGSGSNGTNWVSGDYRLLPTSPCIDTGTNRTWINYAPYDLDYNSRVSGAATNTAGFNVFGMPDMGCYEYTHITWSANISSNRFELKQGITPVLGADSSGLSLAAANWTKNSAVSDARMGTNSIEFSCRYPSAYVPYTINTNIYVSTTGDDSNDGLTLTNALRTFQCAIELAGDNTNTILVADGLYLLTNSIILTGRVNLVSMTEYGAIIDGQSRITCLTNTPTSEGFNRISGLVFQNGYGTGAGGILLVKDATIEHCIFRGNSAWTSAGANNWVSAGPAVYAWHGANGIPYQAEVYDCIFYNNFVAGGASDEEHFLASSTVGGGDYRKVYVRGCLFYGNDYISSYVPWVLGSGVTTTDCSVVVGNRGKTIKSGNIYNTIIWNNSDTNFFTAIAFNSLAPYIVGDGCFTNVDPQFVDNGGGFFGLSWVPGDYRLKKTSPCIHAGTNRFWMSTNVDLLFHPRVCGTNVDMGCYEFGYIDTTRYSKWNIGEDSNHRFYIKKDGLVLFEGHTESNVFYKPTHFPVLVYVPQTSAPPVTFGGTYMDTNGALFRCTNGIAWEAF